MSVFQFVRAARFIGSSAIFSDNVDDVYNLVARKFTANGALVETRAEWRSVLAVRHSTPVTKDVPRGNFDDMILVTWLSKRGRKYAQYFDANTEPSYQYSEEGAPIYRKGKSADGQDANNDGKKDLGMLPLGVYKYDAFTTGHDILGNVFKPKQNVRVWRDINHDGYFTQADEDLVKNEKRMFEGKTMYIHRAYNKARKQTVNTWSAGCQTIMFEDFEEFRKSIAAGNKAGQLEFTYILVNFDG